MHTHRHVQLLIHNQVPAVRQYPILTFCRRYLEAVDGEVLLKVTQKGPCLCFLWSTSLGAGLPVYLWCRLCYTNSQAQIYSCLSALE